MKGQQPIPERGAFSIHNIPFGVISTGNGKRRCASRIGNYVLDLQKFASKGHLAEVEKQINSSFEAIFSQPVLNEFAALPRAVRTEVRTVIAIALTGHEIGEDCLIKHDSVQMHLPMSMGGFTDFYCSLEHTRNCSLGASNVSENWFNVPSCYNSRVSSIIPSGTPIKRPHGVFPNKDGEVQYEPTQQLDYELEMGFFVSKPVPYGQTLKISEIKEHIFGFVLLNDWSSRDIQWYERLPLGPFHGKGFGTSISPWIITLDALENFQCASTIDHAEQTLSHLKQSDESTATFDINLSVHLERDGKEYQTAQSNLKYLYWTPAQQMAHHGSAHCGLNTGDLLGTGTVSGEGVSETGHKLQLGCLFETYRMKYEAQTLADDSKLEFLKDGDKVTFNGWCGGNSMEDCVVGFGECSGVVLGADEL